MTARLQPSLAFALLSFVLIQPSVAQDETPAIKSRQSFQIKVCEFRYKLTGANVTTEQILKSYRNNASIERIQTVRVLITEGSNTNVQFGRQQAVTVGRTNAGRGMPATRQTQQMEVGTLLSASGAVEGEICHLAMRYTSSRFEGEETEDSPPNIVTTTVEGDYNLQFGKPILVAGSTEGGSTMIVVEAKR